MANTPWNLENFMRTDLKPDELDRLIHQKGVDMVWQKSILCSCINMNQNGGTGQPDWNCPACLGKGYYYFDPLTIRAAVTTLTGQRNQIDVGLLDLGTALLTVKTTDLGVNFRDRLTFKDFRVTYSQLLTYDSTQASGQPLKYECENMLRVQQLVNTILPASFTVSPDKKMIKLNANTITDGSNYTVLYEIKPVYIVISAPHELRGQFVKFGSPSEVFVKLPKQYQIKREDLIPMNRG